MIFTLKELYKIYKKNKLKCIYADNNINLILPLEITNIIFVQYIFENFDYFDDDKLINQKLFFLNWWHQVIMGLDCGTTWFNFLKIIY